MGVLFIVAAEEGTGKTAISAGLAINYVNDGKKVGYLRLSPGKSAPNDTDFMKQIEGVEVTEETHLKRYDVVLAEGSTGASADDEASRAAYAAAKEMKARVIAVETYSHKESPYIDAYKGFGKSLLGVVVNKAPESQLKRIREKVTAEFEAAGIKLLGVIPENRTLLAITVGELAESIGGRILNNDEKVAELVENYMLGAMVVDSGLDYFGRKNRKAAIIRHDRPDMQLAALETSTACLVLSGSPDRSGPVPNVLHKAQSRGIPVIAASAAVNDIVTTIEETLLRTRMGQSKKLAALAETVNKYLDTKSLAQPEKPAVKGG